MNRMLGARRLLRVGLLATALSLANCGSGGGGDNGGGNSPLPRALFTTTPPPFAIAGKPYRYTPSAEFQNGKNVSYSLIQSPTGLSIDLNLGTITWTPENAQAGPNTLTIRASDGMDSVDQTATIAVASTTPIATEFVTAALGGTITVTGTGTDLDGLSVDIPPAALVSDETLTIAAVGGLPSLRSGQTQLATPFIILPPRPLNMPISVTCRVEASSLPASGQLTEVFMHTLGTGALSGDEGVFWSALHTTIDALETSAVATACTLGDPITVVQWLMHSRPSFSTPEIEIFAAPDVSDPTITTISSALAQARAYYQSAGFTSIPSQVSVFIEDLGSSLRGYVSPVFPTGIHFSSAQEASWIRATAAHEYFHTVQDEQITCLGLGYLNANERNDWIFEATASFMEDEVFDEDSLYTSERKPWTDQLTRLRLDLETKSNAYKGIIFFKFLVGQGFSMVEFWNNFEPEYLATETGSLAYLDFSLGGVNLEGCLSHFIYAYNVFRREPHPLLAVTATIEEITSLQYYWNFDVQHEYSITSMPPEGYETIEVTLDPLSGNFFGIVIGSEFAGQVMELQILGGPVIGRVYEAGSDLDFGSVFGPVSTQSLGPVPAVGGRYFVLTIVNPSWDVKQSYEIRVGELPGKVKAVGQNASGQLGDGTTEDRSTPVEVSDLSGVIGIGAGWFHTVALLDDGTVCSWGDNLYGQLGDGTQTNRTIPVTVHGLNGVTAIAAGWIHTVALLNDGTVCAWGNNGYGQLGDGTQTNRTTPVTVQGLSGVAAIAAGWFHTVALLNDGTVCAWGNNGYGQLGDGTQTNRTTPVTVQGLNGVTAIAAGWFHTVALLNDGTACAWGYNGYGQLGDGTQTNRTTPVTVQGLNGVTAIAARTFHTVALLNDGTVCAWGYNGYGQLGDGTQTNRTTPVTVQGLNGVTAIKCGGYHTVFLD